MPLQPASRLGPYEVIALIGAGGMGEVYEARDTRLDRKVAVKVLARLRDGTEVAYPGRSRLPPWRDEYLRFSRRVLAIKSRRRADRIDRLPCLCVARLLSYPHLHDRPVSTRRP